MTAVTPERYLTPDATDIDERIAILLRAMAAANEMHLALAYPGFEPYTFGYDKGKRFSRIWVDNGTQRSVCFFVERATGGVWKAAGWKGPTLNFTRGNIMTREGIAALTLDKVRSTGCWYYGI